MSALSVGGEPTVRSLIEAVLGELGDARAIHTPLGDALEGPQPPRWTRLCQLFGLTPLQQRIALLAMAHRIAPWRLPGANLDAPPTAGQLLKALYPQTLPPAAALEAFEASGALLGAGLLRPAPPARRMGLNTPLEMAPHWAAWLDGRRATGPLLATCAERFISQVVPELVVGARPSIRSLAWIAQRLFEQGPSSEPMLQPDALDSPRGAVLVIEGEPGSGKGLLSRAVGAACKRPVLMLRGRQLIAHDHAQRCLQDAMEQAQFFEELLVLRDADLVQQHRPDLLGLLGHFALRRRLVAMVLARHGALLDESLEPAVLYRERLPVLDDRQRALVWQVNAPGELALGRQVDVAALGRLGLTGRQINNAYALLGRLHRDVGQDVSHDQIMACVEHQRWQPVSASSQQQSVALRLGDLVLHDEVRQRLDQIMGAIEVRQRVLDEWGFGRVVHRGTGLVCLFNGEPGTGKTLSAEILAAQAGLKLNHVDVSTIVDKYIGETQKNLARIFDQADPQRELLLFDEADALFSKRTEVSRSTDRYANMEVNVLLQLIERYPGVVALTTNLARQLDPAFERRIMFNVHFGLPDADMREKIWRMHLPPTAPLDPDIDLEALAERYTLSGGAIKNAVLRAAYNAASARKTLNHATLARAARAEAVAAGQLVRDEEP